MEDPPNYDNFTGPGTVLYPDLNPRYHDSEERCCPFDCEWDFLRHFDGNSLDFDWMSQPTGNLNTSLPPEFATQSWPNQLDMSLIGNFEEQALPVDLEQPFFMPPTTLGHVQSSLPSPPSSLYTTQNVSASVSSMSSDFLSMPSTQETPFPAPIPPSPDTSASRPSVCHTCAQPFSNFSRLKYVLRFMTYQPPTLITLSQLTTH
jgi:hypothetical protein